MDEVSTRQRTNQHDGSTVAIKTRRNKPSCHEGDNGQKPTKSLLPFPPASTPAVRPPRGVGNENIGGQREAMVVA